MAITGARIDGAEVRVETGVGRIRKIEPKGERNVHVVIDAEHLRQPVTAWVDRQGPVWPRVEIALEKDLRIWYRVVVHRKARVDPSVPLAEVATTDKVRDLVDVFTPEQAPADPLTGLHGEVTPLQSAAGPATPTTPAPAPAAPAAAPGGPDLVNPTAIRASVLRQLEEVRRTGGRPGEVDFLRQMAEGVGLSPDEIDAALTGPVQRGRPTGEDPFASAPPAAADLPATALAGVRDPDRVNERQPVVPPLDAPPPTSPATGGAGGPAVLPQSGLTRRPPPPASDSRPWEFLNTDGRVNLSSYAAGAVMDTVNLAARLLITRARARHAEDPSYTPTAPTEKDLYGLAGVLLNMADRVQFRMREGGRVDRMASSHKLARQAVREALDLYGVPWGASEDERKKWGDAVTGYALALCNVGIELLTAQ